MNTRILGAVTAVTLVLPHRDPSFGIYDGRTALSIAYLNVESSITFLTQGYSLQYNSNRCNI